MAAEGFPQLGPSTRVTQPLHWKATLPPSAYIHTKSIMQRKEGIKVLGTLISNSAKPYNCPSINKLIYFRIILYIENSEILHFWQIIEAEMVCFPHLAFCLFTSALGPVVDVKHSSRCSHLIVLYCILHIEIRSKCKNVNT